MRLNCISAIIVACLTSALCAASDNHCLNTVVIDPGHGGHDPGGVSKDRKTREKDIALKIALYFGKKISVGYKDSVKVCYTRTDDHYITLQGRADYANSHKADLFISVHINAVDSGKPHGHSVHILGPSRDPGKDLVEGNLNVCKKENSVILLEEDYTTKYHGFDPNDEASYIFMTLMQSAYYEQSIYLASFVEEQLCKGPIPYSRGISQDPFYELWKTAMPSVLLELGFLTNDSDLALLLQDKCLEQIAEKLYQAFRVYKKYYDESMKI